MTKQQYLDKLQVAWHQFKDSFVNLTESQLMQAGVTGRWSVKDILAHVTTWEEEALKYLPLILERKRSPRYRNLYGGMDAFNALMTEKKRTLPLSEVLSQLDATHQRLVEYLSGVPDENFAIETSFRRRLRLDTWGHYFIHARAIQEWREHSK